MSWIKNVANYICFIRINKSPDFGIIVTALQVVQPCFHIVVVPTVAEGVADGIIDKKLPSYTIPHTHNFVKNRPSKALLIVQHAQLQQKDHPL